MFELLEQMRRCEQTPGLTILQHGEMVRDYFNDLLGERRLQWRLPDWINDDRIARWAEHVCVRSTMEAYQLFHDCGKPACRTDEGRFPDHAAVSKRVWLEAGGDPAVGELIGMDMDIHLLKADEVAEFASRPQAIGLLLTGLAEIHANASMFGGLDSTSFKIKWKHINKRGRQILALASVPER